MPMDFPSSPVVNQTYNGYVWSGTAWESASPNTISLTGQVIVADAAARNALYPSPVQGNAVFRTDLGYEEVYYAAHNATTNPGGRTPAGWYPNQRNIGLVPIVPPTVNFSGGSATANTLGTVSFTGVTSISLNNVFTSAYQRYEVKFSATNSSGGANFYFRYRTAGTDASAGNTYYCASYRMRSDSSTFINAGSDNSAIVLAGGSSSSTNIAGQVTIHDIAVSGTKTMQHGQHTVLETNTLNYLVHTSSHTQGTAAYDGLSFFPSVGTITGTIQVFGYNS